MSRPFFTPTARTNDCEFRSFTTRNSNFTIRNPQFTIHNFLIMWLHRYLRFLVFATFCLITAGGLVTSNDYGLAVPDWPKSYGVWMPQMIGGVIYEHGHRMI